jgi:glycosyltransferase involved in cell wall biosynthesis
MSSKDLLSVLVPAYHSSEFILDTLESIKNQSLKNYQVYVSVDKSDDETFEICHKYLKNDHRFKIIDQKTRLGWVGNSNFLLNLVSTEYAVFAFHDDILHPHYFDRLISELEENPQAVVAFSDTLLKNLDNKKEKWIYSELEGIESPLERAFKILNQKGCWWVPNRGVFRSSMVKKIGGLKLNDSGEFSADLPWLFHMSLYGEFVRIPETLCFKYYKPNSLSRSWKFDKKSKYDVIASCMRELWIAEIPTDTKLRIGGPLLNFLIKNRLK